MSDCKEIPYGWGVVKLGEIANYVNGKAFKPTEWGKEGLPIIRIQNLNRKKSEFNYCNFIVDDKYHVNKGDLLFAWSGTPNTSFGAHIWQGGRALLNQHIFRIVINEKKITKQYYLYALNHKIKEFVSKAHGTAGLAHITKKKFEESTIALPLLLEQHRIVAKIEELFSSLDKGIENLKTAQQQLKIYRQAVLKWAFEGNWDFCEFGTIAEIKRGKSKHRPRNAKELFGGLYPFIQTGAVRAANGGTIKTYLQTYSEIGLAQSKLWPKGTLCLTIAANIAETAFLGFDACFPDSIVGIKTDENSLSIKYVNFYIQKLKQELDSKASATAQKNINVEILEKIKLPIPPIKKQNAIVSEIESRLSVCDKIEESLEQSLKQSEALRQSILKKAFEGKLVPQDPNDEPASVLLARIKAEREKNKQENPPRRRPGKTGMKKARV